MNTTIQQSFLEKQCFDRTAQLISKIIEIRHFDPMIDIYDLWKNAEIQDALKKVLFTSDYIAKEGGL